jgi:hypothetical protein
MGKLQVNKGLKKKMYLLSYWQKERQEIFHGKFKKLPMYVVRRDAGVDCGISRRG